MSNTAGISRPRSKPLSSVATHRCSGSTTHKPRMDVFHGNRRTFSRIKPYIHTRTWRGSALGNGTHAAQLISQYARCLLQYLYLVSPCCALLHVILHVLLNCVLCCAICCVVLFVVLCCAIILCCMLCRMLCCMLSCILCCMLCCMLCWMLNVMLDVVMHAVSYAVSYVVFYAVLNNVL